MPKSNRIRYKNPAKDIAKMSAQEVLKEWELLHRLAGTKFMSDFMQARWEKIDRMYVENANAAIRGSY